jgi:hypothetical protein
MFNLVVLPRRVAYQQENVPVRVPDPSTTKDPILYQDDSKAVLGESIESNFSNIPFPE